ncbi:formyl peptide receptor 2-like [Leptodactylus fuscus]|uniref:formyl peptide receptor 2-like n=1 Tax=Leptodactylus fuscus TaxID=238119 RepID=UPI003F4F037E
MVLADYNPTLPNTALDDYNWSFYKDYEGRNTTYYDYYEKTFQKISVTLFSIVFVLGIIGNGLVIWIAGFRMKKTISAMWFLNLAIADFLFCMSLFLVVGLKAELFSYFPYHVICTLIIILFNLNMSASVLLLTAMSIDRCVSVMWPFWAKVHRTRRLVRITAGGIWVVCFFMAGFEYYSREWCTNLQNYSNNIYISKIIGWIRLVIMFGIPFLIILTSYVIIFLKLRKSNRPQRPYRIITAVILCFFICWSPFHIWTLTRMYYDTNYILSLTMYIVIINLAYLNSCLNPIIYVFMGQDFRQGFLRSIPARLERALTDQPDDLCRE